MIGSHGVPNTGGAEIPVDFSVGETLLAEFFLSPSEVGDDFETDYHTLCYGIRTEALAARHFEKVWMQGDFHG